MNEEYLETLGETAARSLRGEEWEQMDTGARRKAAGEMEWQIRDLMSAGFAVVDLNPDRQHSPERTEHTADVLAECLRVLNYAAEKNNGLVYPGTVYRLMGEFRIGGDRLIEVANRTGVFLQGQYDAERLRRNDGADVAGDVAAAIAGLVELRDAAAALLTAATKTQNALSHVAARTEES